MDKQPRHHLTFDEQYALRGWLMANKDRLETLTPEQQLVMAKSELLFQPTQAQLKNTRRALHIKCAVRRTVKPKAPRANGNGQKREVSLQDIALALEGMGEAMAVLVKYQAQVFDQLGVKYGDDLAGLVGRIKEHQRLNG